MPLLTLINRTNHILSETRKRSREKYKTFYVIIAKGTNILSVLNLFPTYNEAVKISSRHPDTIVSTFDHIAKIFGRVSYGTGGAEIKEKDIPILPHE